MTHVLATAQATPQFGELQAQGQSGSDHNVTFPIVGIPEYGMHLAWAMLMASVNLITF